MARILIEAGALSFERSASNTKADRVVTACARAWGYVGDVGDKAAVLAFFGTALVRRLEEFAAAEGERQATGAAAVQAQSDLPTWSL